MNTIPLKKIIPTAEGVGISAEYVNDIILRIEELVDIAIKNRPIAGSGTKIQYTQNGSIITFSPTNTTT